MAGEAFLVHFLPAKYPNEKKGDRWHPLAMECGGESAIMAYLWIYSIGKKKPGGYALPGAKPHRKITRKLSP